MKLLLTNLSASLGKRQTTLPFLLVRGGSTLLLTKNVSTINESRRMSTSHEGMLSPPFSTGRGSDTLWRSSIFPIGRRPREYRRIKEEEGVGGNKMCGLGSEPKKFIGWRRFPPPPATTQPHTAAHAQPCRRPYLRLVLLAGGGNAING